MKLLKTLDIARFVSDGYLRFDGVVPPDVNAAALEQMQRLAAGKMRDPALGIPPSGTPYGEVFAGGDGASRNGADRDMANKDGADREGLRQMLDVPEVAGAVKSLIGENPVLDHVALHQNPAGGTRQQHLHCDAAIDSADPSFDIQILYIPKAVAPGAGGTRFVPGSHIRRVHETSVARYQHVAGEEFFSGEAGTVMIWHHGIWHAGQTNPSDTDRWMFKFRFNPTQTQVRQWDDSDYDSVTPPANDHVFATTLPGSNVSNEIRRRRPWSFSSDHLLDLMEKTRLWRYLSGDPNFDIDWYHTRLENRAAILAGASAGASVEASRMQAS